MWWTNSKLGLGSSHCVDVLVFGWVVYVILVPCYLFVLKMALHLCLLAEKQYNPILDVSSLFLKHIVYNRVQLENTVLTLMLC